MSVQSKRVNVTLDGEHAVKLERMADRAHVSPGTMARSILSTALDHAEADPAEVTALLDGIPGAFERLAEAEREIERGDVVDLDDL